MDYGSTRWKRKREYIIAKDRHKDRVAAMFGEALEGNIVHHIYPSEQYPEYEWKDWNLISVSKATHNKLENRKTGELTKFGRWLQNQIKPEVDWRK